MENTQDLENTFSESDNIDKFINNVKDFEENLKNSFKIINAGGFKDKSTIEALEELYDSTDVLLDKIKQYKNHIMITYADNIEDLNTYLNNLNKCYVSLFSYTSKISELLNKYVDIYIRIVREFVNDCKLKGYGNLSESEINSLNTYLVGLNNIEINSDKDRISDIFGYSVNYYINDIKLLISKSVSAKEYFEIVGSHDYIYRKYIKNILRKVGRVIDFIADEEELILVPLVGILLILFILYIKYIY